MSRSRFCRVCRQWHDLSEEWPLECLGHFSGRNGSSLQIIKDIEPYRAVAADVASGKAPIITSRAAHREFLKRNGYVEVGNEYNKGPRGPRHKAPIEIDSPRDDIRRAVRDVLGRR